MYKFVASVKDCVLLESTLGTYQIIKSNKIVAHPATEDAAWERIRFLTGRSNPEPQCWSNCRIHNCIDCERYYD